RRNSAAFPSLLVASRSLGARLLALLEPQRLPLDPRQLDDALARQVQQGVALLAAERRPLGGALDLDEASVLRRHAVHVHVGAEVLVVVQVEARLAVD